MALITTLLLAAGSLLSGGLTAHAEGGATVYPEDGEFIKPLVFENLTDYAVAGDNYAFIEREKENDVIKVYDGTSLNLYPFTETVSALDTDGEKFYYSIGESVYSLPDKAESKHKIPDAQTTISVDGYTYNLSDATLKVADFKNEDKVTTFVGEYKNLKCFDNTVYAIKENSLYKFNGAEEEKLEYEYVDYSSTLKIEVGQTRTDLVDGYELKFVTIKAGSYMTEVDLSQLEGQYLASGETAPIKQDTTALLLCYTGNSAIVAIGEKSYITLKTATAETQERYTTAPEFENATVTGNRIYASPFVIVGTSVLFPATGTIVKINGKIEHEVLGSAFYEVEYTDAEGNTHTGYVTYGFLTEYIIEDNKPPNEFPDPAYSEKNDVRNVILILMVVILVLVAAGYLTYVATTGKRKKSGLPTDDESASANNMQK